MAKFSGMIGYTDTIETAPGVWNPDITERRYSGDVLKNSRRLEAGESTNDDVTINNTISIVADAFAYQNFHAFRYVVWMGARWKITNIEVLRPRLILTIGGIYNGPTPSPPTDPGEPSGE